MPDSADLDIASISPIQNSNRTSYRFNKTAFICRNKSKNCPANQSASLYYCWDTPTEPEWGAVKHSLCLVRKSLDKEDGTVFHWAVKPLRNMEHLVAYDRFELAWMEISPSFGGEVVLCATQPSAFFSAANPIECLIYYVSGTTEWRNSKECISILFVVIRSI